ncbi:hypothetical protein SAY86_020138 [Trapa natans]|uniref:BHLH domain-containing protein n=1 Tax=Trapa natans TaxID=22666 RepID=A0AAN7LQ29_TRANT|nr:hypothetical protein SAY86_020138 [Trapa natans]
MAQNGQRRVPDSLGKLLSLAVRSIQWSYAIFWSVSATRPGVLEWGDGYYNGDIKTRKTIQAVEIKADELELQRSKQLKELYDSLAAGESSPQSKRPSASLSPEDLSDTEWYYLVCMSFVFDVGEGLPGRTLASGQPSWLCNASNADSKVFSRSLLAKSASIQTIVCFPFSGGVVELGTTDLVMEDHGLIGHIKTSLLEKPYSMKDVKTYDLSIGDKISTEDIVFDPELIPVFGTIDVTSPNMSSSGFGNDHLEEDEFMVGGLNGAASQVPSWQFVDDEFSYSGVLCSLNHSDCISQAFVEPVKVLSFPNGGKLIDQCYAKQVDLIEPHRDDVHYQSVLSSLLKSHHQVILVPHIRGGVQGSSFMSWKTEGAPSSYSLDMANPVIPQRVLKGILFDIPQKHQHRMCLDENDKKDEVTRPESDKVQMNHMLSSGRVEKELISERFNSLKSIASSNGKVDQVALLDETIDYLMDLQRRVDELEAIRKKTAGLDSKLRKKSRGASRRTSDSGDCIKSEFSKRSSGGKRKIIDADQTEEETEEIEGLIDNSLTISVMGKSVEMELRCVWREGVLLDIMEVLSSLHLDLQSAQSSNIDGVLSLRINSKFRGSATVPARTIRQALQVVVRAS